MTGGWTRWRPTRDEIVDGVFAVALTAIALVGFHPVIGGWRFLVVGTLAAVAGAVVAHAIERSRLPGAAGVGIACLAFLLVGAILVAPDECLFGVVPTPDAVRDLMDGVVSSWRRMLTTLTPTGTSGNLLGAPVAAGYVTALGTVLISRRPQRLILVLLLPTILLGVGLAFGPLDPTATAGQGLAFALGALIWSAVRRERGRPPVLGSSGARRNVLGVVMVALIGVVGLWFAGRMPFVDNEQRFVLDRTEPPFDPRSLASPLNGYQRLLVDLRDEVLFTVEGLPDSGESYVRLAVLDDYDGVVWRVSPGSREQGGRFVKVGSTVPIDVAGEPRTLRVRIGDLPDGWLPAFGVVEGIEWRVESDRSDLVRETFKLSTVTSTGVLTASGGWAPGDGYELQVVVPTELTPADVVDRPVDPNAIVKVAAPISDGLRAVGASVTKGKATPHAQVEALEQYFKQGYYVSGDPEGAANAPGHSLARLESFVANDTPIGNAEQYASAFAVILRSLDIPARVITGFKVPVGETEVLGKYAHAWVEVGYDRGWVRYDPTSDNVGTPVVARKRPRPVFESQDVPPPPVVPPEPEVNARSSKNGESKPARPDEVVEPSEGGLSTLAVGLIVGLGVPLMVLGVFAFVVLLLKRRRRRRRRRAPTNADQVAGAWGEYLDAARDAGRPVAATATRRERAVLAGGGTGLVLATRADRAVFGPAPPPDEVVEEYWTDTERAITDLKRSLPLRERVRAALSTTSLRDGS